MSDHKCSQESSIERVEKRLESIETKIDKFIQRVTVLDTQFGFVKTGLLVVVVPVLVYIIQQFIRG